MLYNPKDCDRLLTDIMCMYCKYSYKRSEFDIMDKGKWAYEYICTLTNEYKQCTNICDSYKKGENTNGK